MTHEHMSELCNRVGEALGDASWEVGQGFAVLVWGPEGGASASSDVDLPAKLRELAAEIESRRPLRFGPPKPVAKA